MTFVATVLIGAGMIFIGSSLDNTPLVDTFKKIINGKSINWTGQTVTPTTTTSATKNPSTGGSTGIGSSV